MSQLTVTRDAIQDFYGSWGSGLATLVFQSGNQIYCENGQTVRSLDNFAEYRGLDSIIKPNHTVDIAPLRGIEIVWFEDELGYILGGFVDYDEWLDRGLQELELGITTLVNLPESNDEDEDYDD